MGCVAKPGESSLQQELTRPRRLSLVESEVVGDSSGGFGSVSAATPALGFIDTGWVVGR